MTFIWNPYPKSPEVLIGKEKCYVEILKDETIIKIPIV